jgi:hypothetical protein
VVVFFDSIDWELMLRAVRHHRDCPSVLLYIERWLKAPVQMEDGNVVSPRASVGHRSAIFSAPRLRKSGSHKIRRWRERDSNPRSPVRRTTIFETPPSVLQHRRGNPTPRVYQRLDFPMRIPVSGVPIGADGDPTMMLIFADLSEC